MAETLRELAAALSKEKAIFRAKPSRLTGFQT